MEPILTFSDFSEKMQLNIPDFPLYAQTNDLSRFGYWGACHWHAGVEFVMILSGEMDFFVNGDIRHLTARNGLFVNSKRMHYGFSQKRRDCQFIDVIIDPALFHQGCAPLARELNQVFGGESADYLILSTDHPETGKIFELIRTICQMAHQQNRAMITLQANCMLLCAAIAEQLTNADNVPHTNQDQEVWKMVDYIHRNWRRKMTVDDIANAGALSRTRCFESFKAALNQTPNDYLTRYRLTMSSQLLVDTRMSIKEISAHCGFQSQSYFCALFKRYYRRTPVTYRQTAERN